MVTGLPLSCLRSRRHADRHRWVGHWFAGSVLLLATACTGAQDIEFARQVEVAGGAFNAALYRGYLDLADAEAAQADWLDVQLFYDKAQAVERGDPVDPEPLEDWSLTETALPDLTVGRSALIDVLARGAPEFAPIEAAAAQVSFDCWVEQQNEGFQEEDISSCRLTFEQALAQAQAATSGVIMVLLPSEDGSDPTGIDFATDAGSVAIDQPLVATQAKDDGDAPVAPVALRDETVDTLFGEAIAAQPDDPVDYVLYFVAGTADLTEESSGQLGDIVSYAQGRPVISVRVVGHTDTVGSAATNARLSVRRASGVRDLLIEAGLPEDGFDVFSLGESDPLVPTPDETPEPLNRRVVVTVR